METLLMIIIIGLHFCYCCSINCLQLLDNLWFIPVSFTESVMWFNSYLVTLIYCNSFCMWEFLFLVNQFLLVFYQCFCKITNL